MPTESVSATDVPVLRTDWRWADAVRDIVQGAARWELWGTLGWQDIRQRYRLSVIGPFWLTLSTGVLVGTMGVLYSGLFRQPVLDYMPQLALGFIVWGLISNLILEGCGAFVAAQAVIRQVKSPLSVHVFRVVWRNLIVFAHNFLVYVGVAAALAIWPGPAALLAIPGLLLLCLNGLWTGLLLGLLCARFRDIPSLVANIVQVVFFLTPIIWKADQVGHHIMLINLNPFFHMVEIVRLPLLGQVPDWTSWAASIGVTLAGWATTLGLYARFRGRIAYWV
jgi:ABC-type polysaccharide/polyol phosphate export permease